MLNKQEDQKAKTQAKVDACNHERTTNAGVRGWSKDGGHYTVLQCLDCPARIFVFDDGSEQVHAPVLPEDDSKSFRESLGRADYAPLHDGVDAFNDWVERSRRPMYSNLFDKRGGAGGVGD